MARARQWIVLGLLAATPLSLVLGVFSLGVTDNESVAVSLQALTLLLGAAAMLASIGVHALRSRAEETGGTEYDELRHGRTLRTSALLLNMLLFVVLLALILLAAVLAGYSQVQPPSGVVPRATTFLLLVLILNHAHAHYASLRTPAPRKPSAATHALHVAGVIASAALAITAIAVGRAPVRILDYTTLTPEHAPILLLGGAFLLGLSLFVGRNLPGFYEQLTERRDFYTGRSVLAQPKTFFVPAVGAFTLLFLVILVLLLLGVGAQGFRQPLQVGVVAFILAALAGSIWVSLRLARSEDQVQYRGIAAEERRGGKIVLFGSAAAASILLGLALVLYLGKNVGGLGSGAWIDVFALGLLLGLGPYGFYVHRRGKRIRNLEARFPEFLRDLAASHKSGLTLNASVAISARGEYGELTPEIRKMADQLSWNLSFEEALRLMAERVQTPLVQRTASLIIQAGKSGGNTTDVLLAAARDAREIKTLENERRTNMTLYTIIIYLTFIIFLVIVAVLYKSFVPEILRAGALARQAGPVGGGGIVEVLDLEEYRGFYFLAALVQGLGNGLLAGLMQTGRAIQGLRHSFLFVLAAYITFGWLL